MKRNQDLCLKILRRVEALPDLSHGRLEIEGYSWEQVGYNIKLLPEDGGEKVPGTFLSSHRARGCIVRASIGEWRVWGTGRTRCRGSHHAAVPA